MEHQKIEFQVQKVQRIISAFSEIDGWYVVCGLFTNHFYWFFQSFPILLPINT